VPSVKTLDPSQQSEITRIVVFAAQIMQQHGAESKLIDETTGRLGRALGCESVELAISANALVLTTLYNGKCITTTRRVLDRGINMQMVCEVQRICIMAEKQILRWQEVKQRLHQLKPFKYNRWLVILCVGLSCASFSHLLGGDWPVFGVTFTASACAMFIRQEIAHRHHNPLINFAVTAFFATLIASVGVHMQWGDDPSIAMAASVLLLVPGFPFINAVSDLMKGHINMGIARWVAASLLTFSVAVGIVLAISVSGIKAW